MSIMPKELVHAVADYSAVVNVHDDVALALASETEYRVRDIIGEARKFAAHRNGGGKDSPLNIEDLQHAMDVRNIEPIVGFNMSASAAAFKPVTVGAGASELYYVEDKEVDLKELISAPLPPCPLDMSFSAHWLAVEGVQPAIPQNPNPNIPVPSGGINAKRGGELIEGEGGVKVKPVVKHTLSKELQLFYDKVIEAVHQTSDIPLQEAALHSLAADPGLTQLLPYFNQHISDTITTSLKRLPTLVVLMRMVQALLDNPALYLEPYLHQLLPAMLTCLVGKKLCRKPREDHWSLRDTAAKLVARVCDKYGNAVNGLQARVTKTLLTAFLDASKPLTTHYGAVSGLFELGGEAIHSLLLPNLRPYGLLLEPILNNVEQTLESVFLRDEAERVYHKLLEAAGMYLRAEQVEQKYGSTKTGTPTSQSEMLARYRELYGMFGDKLLAHLS